MPRFIDLYRLYKKAARISRRSVLNLVLEASKLRFSKNKLGFSEYLDFQLYLNDISFQEKLAFGGIRVQTILDDILVDNYSRFLSLDKVTMYSVLQAYSLPIPPIRAIYKSNRPNSLTSISLPEELEKFLLLPDCLPIYIKRAFGGFGRGNILVQRIEGDSVVLGNASLQPISEFCNSLDDGKSLGWILQQPLFPHADIKNLTNVNKISGLRVHTFLSEGVPVLTKAIFKINVGTTDVDNFEHGATGNLLGAIDLHTGRIHRVIAGTGLNQVANFGHPNTGQEIVGFQIPHWKATVDLVIEASKAFPGYICPGWDVAICEDGPVLLEVNFFGDIDLAQHAYRAGFLDENFMSLMRKRELLELLFAHPRPRLRSAINGRLGLRHHHWKW